MNLALSDEQVFLREAARGALSRFKTIEAAREALDGNAPLPDLWPTAREAGWPGLLIDESAGGAGARHRATLEPACGVGAPAFVEVAGGTAGQVGDPPLALRQGSQVLGGVRRVAEDRRRGQVAEQRYAGEHAAALAEHEHRVEGVEAGAAGGLVDQETGPAGFPGGRPEVGQRLS